MNLKNKLKRFISRKTAKFRYICILKIAKKFTPDLFYKMNLMTLLQSVGCEGISAVSKTPRPAILQMKDYFSNNKIVGVEIGVLEGNNSESILNILNIEKIFLVDVWDKISEGVINRSEGLKSYKRVLKRFKGNKLVKIMKNTSKEGSVFFEDDSLDFVYIDAEHTYQSVFNDLEYWARKVKKGGFIAGHDIFNSAEVLIAVKDWCEKNKTNFSIKLPDWYFIKN